MRINLLRHRILFGATLLTAGSTFAQVTSIPVEGEPVELSPFEVSSERDVGYLAANSLAGTRLNTSLKDTAASISVFTEEFLADIGANTLEDAMVYANNLDFDLNDAANNAAPNNNVLVTGFQSYRVRGLPATIARNYFEWNIPVDNFNITRIEDSRGPNSVLFGIAQAGGLLNVATKQAMTGRSFRKASVNYGSFDSYRGALDVNQTTFNRKMAVRFNAVYGRANSFRHFLFNHDRRVHLAVKYNLGRNTSVRAEYEGGIIRANVARPFNLTNGAQAWLNAGRPTVNAPNQGATGTGTLNNNARITYIDNNGLLMNMAGRRITNGNSTVVLDESVADRSVNVTGPGTTRFADYDTGSIFLEHRLGKNTYVELAYNRQHYKNDSKDPTVSSSDLKGDPNNFLPNGAPNPYAGQVYLEAAWFRNITEEESESVRAAVTTELDAGKWGLYRLVGLAEYQDSRVQTRQMGEFWDGGPFGATPEGGVNQVWRRHYLTEGDWKSYRVGGEINSGPIVNMVDPITGRSFSSVWHNRAQGENDIPTTIKSLLLGTQGRYLKNRVILNLGYREDRAESLDPDPNVRDPITNRLVFDYSSGLVYDYTGRTKTAGLVSHLTKNITLLGNYATNLGLPNPRNTIIGGARAPAREGEGKDIGIALNFLDGKIYARAVYYETFGNNLTGARDTNALTTTTDRVLAALVDNNVITQAEANTRTTSGANVATYSLESSGYEFQLTANPTKNWRLMANFSITDASEGDVGPEVKAFIDEQFPLWESNGQYITSNGISIADELVLIRSALDEQFETEGDTVFGNRRHKVNVFTRYGFSGGPLDGLTVGAGYNHKSKIVIGRNAATRENQYGNSYYSVDAMLGYTVRGLLPSKMKLKLQLNVSNVLDDTEALILRYQGVNIRRLSLRPPRTWRLTANLDF